MPKFWKLVSYEVSQKAYREAVEKLEKHAQAGNVFPPGVMDNVPVDFLLRCKWSSEVDGCVAFCYKGNGAEPMINMVAHYGSQPTYKGLPPKRVSFIGKTGTDPGPGAVIKPTCGSRLCVNQMHLEQQGFTKNQFMD